MNACGVDDHDDTNCDERFVYEFLSSSRRVVVVHRKHVVV
jgi:hypothetical protein